MRRAGAFSAAAGQPESRGERGEVRQERENERGARHEAELAQRREAREGQGGESRRVDDGRVDDRSARYEQRVGEGLDERRALPLVTVMEEEGLIGLSRPQHGGGGGGGREGERPEE